MFNSAAIARKKCLGGGGGGGGGGGLTCLLCVYVHCHFRKVTSVLSVLYQIWLSPGRWSRIVTTKNS